MHTGYSVRGMSGKSKVGVVWTEYTIQGTFYMVSGVHTNENRSQEDKDYGREQSCQ